MRIQSTPGTTACLVAILSILIIASNPQPAVAQSFFETLFGFLGPKPKPSQPSNGNLRNPFADGQSNSYGPTSYGGRYRTVCVRLCDGYFFPISNGSSRRDFYSDAQKCSSRCQSETRLYYMSPMAPDIKQARDQRGLSYRDLKTAFLYRKKLVKSCTCRPAPWTTAERQRHKTYESADPESVANLDNNQIADPSSVSIAEQPGNAPADGGPVAIASAYAAPTTPGYFAQQQRPLPRMTKRTKRRNQQESGFGSSFASGLPKVRYRHNWSSD